MANQINLSAQQIATLNEITITSIFAVCTESAKVTEKNSIKGCLPKEILQSSLPN